VKNVEKRVLGQTIWYVSKLEKSALVWKTLSRET